VSPKHTHGEMRGWAQSNISNIEDHTASKDRAVNGTGLSPVGLLAQMGGQEMSQVG